MVNANKIQVQISNHRLVKWIYNSGKIVTETEPAIRMGLHYQRHRGKGRLQRLFLTVEYLIIILIYDAT